MYSKNLFIYLFKFVCYVIGTYYSSKLDRLTAYPDNKMKKISLRNKNNFFNMLPTENRSSNGEKFIRLKALHEIASALSTRFFFF